MIVMMPIQDVFTLVTTVVALLWLYDGYWSTRHMDSEQAEYC